MRIIELEIAIQDTMKQIAEAEAKLQRLRTEKYELEIQDLDKTDIPTIFNQWVDNKVASTEEPYIINLVASSGRDLFDTHDWSRHVEVTCEDLADVLNNMLSDLPETEDIMYEVDSTYDHAAQEWNYEPTEDILYTRQDIYDWMQLIMDMDLKSFVMDW